MLVAKMNSVSAKVVIGAVALIATFALSFAFAQPAHAGGGAANNVNDTFGFTQFEQGNPQLGNRDLRTTVASIINVALSLLGVVAVVIILMGGFKWMTAAGNDDKVGEAKKTIGAGIIGLIIILAGYSITRFVVEQTSRATLTGQAGQAAGGGGGNAGT